MIHRVKKRLKLRLKPGQVYMFCFLYMAMSSNAIDNHLSPREGGGGWGLNSRMLAIYMYVPL